MTTGGYEQGTKRSHPPAVIPAKAGTQYTLSSGLVRRSAHRLHVKSTGDAVYWFPAFAGMTSGDREVLCGSLGRGGVVQEPRRRGR
jgi:homoserine kinase